MKHVLTILAVAFCLTVPCRAQEITSTQIMHLVLQRDANDIQTLKVINYKKKTIKDEPGKESVITYGSYKDDDGLEITIQNIFREGRYLYRFGTVPNCSEIGIIFNPKPEKNQLAALPGAGWKQSAFNKALNNLRGTLCVDRKTYGIIGFDSQLSKKLSMNTFGRVYNVTIHYEQQYLCGAWLPRTITSFVHFSFASWIRGQDFRHYTVTFEYPVQCPCP